MPMQNHVTMKDVARLAKVSVAAVSVILNSPGNNRFSEDANRRVLDAAAQLNYHPDINAQTLRGKASSVIGLIIPSISNHFYPEMAEGIMDKAKDYGYNVVIFNTRDDLEKEKFSVNTLIAMRAAGILVAGIDKPTPGEQEIFQSAIRAGTQVIQVDRYTRESQIPSVSVDNRAAAYEMTEKLILDGHERIAIVLPEYMIYPMCERRDGFLKALSDYQIPFYLEDLHQIHVESITDIGQSLSRILHSSGKYTAIFVACGDRATVKYIQKAKEIGCRVPEDISIAGFDGIGLGEVISPALTTIQQPIYEIGVKAMEIMRDVIVGRKIPKKEIFLPYTLVSRESTRKI